MSSSKFSDEFKRDAVTQITERGYPVREVSERLGVTSGRSSCQGGLKRLYIAIRPGSARQRS